MAPAGQTTPVYHIGPGEYRFRRSWGGCLSGFITRVHGALIGVDPFGWSGEIVVTIQHSRSIYLVTLANGRGQLHLHTEVDMNSRWGWNPSGNDWRNRWDRHDRRDDDDNDRRRRCRRRDGRH